MGPYSCHRITAMFSLPFYYASSTQHKFCLENICSCQLSQIFLGQPSPTQVVQSDTLLAILNTNVMSYAFDPTFQNPSQFKIELWIREFYYALHILSQYIFVYFFTTPQLGQTLQQANFDKSIKIS